MDYYRQVQIAVNELKRRYGYDKSDEEIMKLMKKEQEEERVYQEWLLEDIRKQNIKMCEELQKKEKEKVDYEKFILNSINGYITKEEFAETVKNMSEDEKIEFRKIFSKLFEKELIRKRDYDINKLIEEECTDEKQRDVFKKILFDLMYKRISTEEYIEKYFSKLTDEERNKLLKIQKTLMEGWKP